MIVRLGNKGLLCSLALAFALAACGEGETLGSGHPGWGEPDCSQCHSLPVEDHSETRPPECASCHGANGACDPMASKRAHSADENCGDCHGQSHGFSAASDCVSCHFATEGVRSCP